MAKIKRNLSGFNLNKVTTHKCIMYVRVKKRENRYGHVTYYFYARKSIRSETTKKVVKKDTYLFKYTEIQIFEDVYKNDFKNSKEIIDDDLEKKLLNKFKKIKKVLTPTKIVLTKEQKERIYYRKYGNYGTEEELKRMFGDLNNLSGIVREE